MRQIIFTLLMLAALSCNLHAQEVDTIAYFDPEQVMVVEEDTAEMARLEACQLVAGTWQYNKPYVHAQGSSVMGKLGKPIAKSKLKKGLDKAFNKLNIKTRWSSMTLSPDGTYEMHILGLPIKGKYDYDPAKQSLTLRYKGIPLKSHAHCDGKKLYMAFDVDRLLVIMKIISGMSHSATLKALSFLSQNYHDVMVGFEMKIAK